ncbi:organelle RRM domain-containing protein 6, chloroplastic-like isoform X1 [Euphorbia lathyris]|uniref:organelle RRM domain-containing protein 6, chloroplastic-like isoform X1 n=1 Tax=Euphorbia lathyris TaxID=212925 RepID=UPI0033131C68
MAAVVALGSSCSTSLPSLEITRFSFSSSSSSSYPSNGCFKHIRRQFPSLVHTRLSASLPSPSSSSAAASPSPSSSDFTPKPPRTRLFVSGLSFRTTEESLRNAFENFGKLVEVNLVMDKLANRPRGFAFLRYSTQEESLKAVDEMHGKFLDGRVIFVEIAKSRRELRERQEQKQF